MELYGFLDGKIVPCNELSLPISSTAGFCGFTIFEGIRSYPKTKSESCIFRVDDHLNRLQDSCKATSINIRVSKKEMKEWCKSVILANPPELDLHLRLGVAVLGEYTERKKPYSYYILTRNIGRAENSQTGITVCISTYFYPTNNSGLQQAKVGSNYYIYQLALLEAKRLGFEDALLMNSRGEICEATGANIFIIKDNKIITPPLSQGVLAGITRSIILEKVNIILEDQDFKVFEDTLTRYDLYTADEVFLCGTGVEILPVVKINNHCIGSGTTGKLTKKIQSWYLSMVRGNTNTPKEWLTLLRRN